MVPLQVQRVLVDNWKKMGKPVSTWLIEEFKSIPNQYSPILPNETININDLSTDQYYAYRICWAVILSEIDSDLSLLEVDPVVHSRWLTLECRILCLYISTKTPPKKSAIMAEFCVMFCFPTWFEIKHKSNVSDTSNHFF